ncbi:ABC transporter ATP-binding protein/permease [Candidatus Saccharibacteria bacterium]|nr:ABC transporter ATP-binding protein/permease [Candidatus Saccharibacteria bacterium]
MLELRGVTKVYTTGGLEHKALNGVSVNFRANEFAAILGPSGSGKTTLLNIIGGLDHYTSGDLKINEISTKKFKAKNWDSYRNHRVGFVFQSYNLIPHQTILNNVRLALTLSGVSKKESIRRAKKALKDVGLEDQIYKKPSQLSGGQAQRVAIARALVNDPDILLADEPTGALDSTTSLQIMELLKNIAKEKLVIMVTHNPELANKYANRIINLKDGKITSDSHAYDGKANTKLNESESKQKSQKTKMSFFTAISLSLQNLLTKKARTILVAFAGSIGIIGIALISAVSTGFQNYIDSIEEDALSSYPLTLMRESADITGVLLSITGSTGGEAKDGIVKENPVLSSMLGSVTTNDLENFGTYLNDNFDEVRDDLRLIEYQYSVSPLIYTRDATNKLAKLNPSDLFSSVMGGDQSIMMNYYSSTSSVFQQMDLSNIKENSKLVAGRFPEKYNELVIGLSDPSQISDFLTYSLGFHDTSELSSIVTKLVSGEKVNINNEPLELTYDDLMAVDLRLISPPDIYKYNAKYDVYEDMSGDTKFMEDLYANAEKLKIVGIVAPNSQMVSLGSGVLYLPELVTHIINKSADTPIVKKQLENPKIDIFSGKKFGQKSNDFSFEFSDLVSVDQAKLSQAFGGKINQKAITAKTTEYMTNIGKDISKDVKSIPEIKTTLEDRFKSLIPDALAATDLNEYLEGLDFADLEQIYYIPAAQFKTAYQGLIQGYLTAYAASHSMLTPELYLAMPEVSTTFDTLSITIAEISLQKDVMEKIGGLTTYLTNTFSSAFKIDQNALLSAFKLNFSEEELARVVQSMFNRTESTLNTNLTMLGYQNLKNPSYLSFYFNSFDGKTRFMEFLDNYNTKMHDIGDEDKVIEYTDATGVLMSSVKTIVDAVSYVLIAFVSISLVVSSIMIGVITYISVYERTKEIGILRAIGASKHNISSIFNAETFIIGLLSGLIGVGVSYLLIPPINLVLHQFTGDIPLSAALDPRVALRLIILSVILTLIGGLIPARAASKKDPVEALRSE